MGINKSTLKIIAGIIALSPLGAAAQQPCATGRHDDFRPYLDLIQNVNLIMGRDDDPNGSLADIDGRGSLFEVGAEYGFSQKNLKDIAAATGYVICPVANNPNAKFIVGSGFLAVTNGQIGTSQHQLDEVVATEGQAGLSRCFFRNQASPAVKIPLDFSSQAFIPAKVGPNGDGVAFVRLTTPLSGVNPLAIDLSQVEPGTKVLAVSAWQEGMTKKVDGGTPIGSIGYVEDLKTYGFYSDLDMKMGGSGGVVLGMNEIDGTPMIKAVVLSTGPTELDGRAYRDSSRASERSVTYSVHFTESLIRTAEDLDHRFANPGVESVKAEVHPSKPKGQRI